MTSTTDEVLHRLRAHPDERVRAVAAEAQDTPSAGVHAVTRGERADARRRAVDLLGSGTVHAHDLGEQPAAVVTALLAAAVERPDAGRWVTAVAAALPEPFRPDVPGLLRVYGGLLALSDPEYAALWDDEPLPRLPRLQHPPPLDSAAVVALRRTVAWIAARAGLAPLLVALDRHLVSTATSDGYAIVRLMVDAAEVVDAPRPPDVAPAPAPPAISDDDVQFTVYRPGTAGPARWHPLLAFAHRSSTFVDEDGHVVDAGTAVARQARALLGTRAPDYGTVRVDSAASLPHGSVIVFEPWIDGGEVNPPRAAFRWEEPVHRVEFRFRVPATADGQRLRGGLRVYLDVIRLADLTFTVRVDGGVGQAAAAPPEPVRGRPHQRIFAAYSHRDREIVARLRALAPALGARYVGDHDLQAGEEWEARLEEMIDEATMFQLFWSRNSMRSPFVRREWEHALSLNRPHFVVPVYWEDPRPEDRSADLPPADLDRLHFCLLGPADVGPAAVAPAPAVDGFASPGVDVGDGSTQVVRRPDPPTVAGARPVPPPPARRPPSSGVRAPHPAAPPAAHPPRVAAPETWGYAPGGYAPGAPVPPPPAYGPSSLSGPPQGAPGSYGPPPPSWSDASPSSRRTGRVALVVALVAVVAIVVVVVVVLLLR